MNKKIGLFLVVILIASLAIYYYVTERNKNITTREERTPTTETDDLQQRDLTQQKELLYVNDVSGYKVIASNFDGSSKSILSQASGMGVDDFAKDSMRFIRVRAPTPEDLDKGSVGSLWIVDKESPPKKILSLRLGESMASPRISDDGSKIVYSLFHFGKVRGTDQLWVINADGSSNTLIADETNTFITDPGPFRLIPLAWSKDKTKVYLITTSDSEATPTGMYVADLLTNKIEKAKTPKLQLWDVTFSPDKSKIAYSNFEWRNVTPDSWPEPGPPFYLNITNLKDGSTVKISENNSAKYAHMIWSKDGGKIAYTLLNNIEPYGYSHNEGKKIFVVDINSKKILSLISSTGRDTVQPAAWLSDGRIVYTEDRYNTENKSSIPDTRYLFSVKSDGTDKRKIDSGSNLRVLGSLDLPKK